MNDEKSQSRSILLAALGVAVITSIAVACGTYLAPTMAPALPETRAQVQPPAPTTAPTDTPQPPTDTPAVVPTSTARPTLPPPTRTAAPPTDTPATSPTPAVAETEEGGEDEEGGMMADAGHGQQLFSSLGCTACHGPQGEGLIGPTIAGTDLPLSTVVRQYRAPYQNMPRFGPDQVSEADIADIYAFLQTLPTPQATVPSVLANVTPEAGIGAIRGVIRYGDTGQPAANEQIYVVQATENADGSLTFTYLAHQPAGTTDSDGRFEIADVEARLYGVFYSRQEAPILDTAGNVLLVSVLPAETAEVEGVIPSP